MACKYSLLFLFTFLAWAPVPHLQAHGLYSQQGYLVAFSLGSRAAFPEQPQSQPQPQPQPQPQQRIQTQQPQPTANAPNIPLVRQQPRNPAQYPPKDLQQRLDVNNQAQLVPQPLPQPAVQQNRPQVDLNGRPVVPTVPTPAVAGAIPIATPISVGAPVPPGPFTTVQAHNAPSAGPVAQGPPRPAPKYSYMENFSSHLFKQIWPNALNQNMVYSPSSLHSILGLIYGASGGETAEELRVAGKFSAKKAVAEDFERLFNMLRGSPNAQLSVLSRVFYNYKLGGLNPDYRNYAVTYFNSDIEKADFANPKTADRINAWVSDSTSNRIRNLVSPNDFDDKTEAFLINAVFFKARWANEFSAMDTMDARFRVNSNTAVNVKMMFNDDIFDYVDLPELNAKALELPYASTSISMLFILPNEIDGLAQLEHQLGDYDLNKIAARLRRESVTVRIPRFRIEFEQDMTGPLQKMNVRRMFQKNSQVDAMLMPHTNVMVSKIIQKASIDVNEAGSEAAAATYAKFVPLSLPVKAREFNADHPFVFAIRTPDAVLFIGHVVDPPHAAS